jgi:transposase
MVKFKEKIDDPLKLLLPGVIYDYFELVHTEVSDVDVHLFLDEQHNPPKVVGYESKGFTEQSIIQDFPLRGKPVYLHIRRRKWLEKSTGKVLTNSYDLTHLGTQITAEFAAFLKDVYRE